MLCAMIRRLACGTMLTAVAFAFGFGRAVRPGARTGPLPAVGR